MKEIYKTIIKNLDLSNCKDLLDYFQILKTSIPVDDLIFGVLKVSYSTFYQFNQQAKKGILLHGKLYKQLLKLYTLSTTGVFEQ